MGALRGHHTVLGVILGVIAYEVYTRKMGGKTP